MLSEQARASGKPEAIIEKMVEGRIRKYYEEVVLLEQVWVHDGESRVRRWSKKAGAKLDGFARLPLGEGIEKQTGDFAAEVAAAAGVTRLTRPAEPTSDDGAFTCRGRAASLGCARPISCRMAAINDTRTR